MEPRPLLARVLGWQLTGEAAQGRSLARRRLSRSRPSGLTGQGQGWRVTWWPWARGSVSSTELWPDHLQELRLDFGSTVPLRTRVNRQLILTNRSPIQTPFTLKFEYFGGPPNGPNQKPSL